MKVITTVVGSLQTNCYLLIDEETKSAALIDPGDEAEKLLELVKSEGVTLKYILLTHGHRDHTLAVPALKKALPDVPVYIGEADAHSTGIYHYPMADLVPDLKYYGEGDTLPLGSLTIKVLATPGHTLGGVTLLVCLLTNHYQQSRVMAILQVKLEELARQVDKHNSVIERTYRLEESVALHEEKIKVANHRIDDLERGGETA